MSDIKEIIQIVSGRRFSLSDEKRLQAEIEEALKDAGVEHQREYRLDSSSIIDFMIRSIGVEVKIKGSKLNIYRQIERYAGFDEIRRIILITNVPMGMPPLVNGKPVYLVNLAKAWL